MQALIAVCLGHGNVILEAPIDGAPQGMHKAKNGVAVLDILHKHPEGHDVVHFIQGERLGLHFLVNAVFVLDAPIDFARNVIGPDQVFQAAYHLVDLVLRAERWRQV